MYNKIKISMNLQLAIMNVHILSSKNEISKELN